MIQTDSYVKCNRPMSIEGKNNTLRLPPGQIGKVVKVHTDYDPPCWFSCQFKHPSEPFIIALHIINLVEVGEDGKEIVAAPVISGTNTSTKTKRVKATANSEPDIVTDEDIADLEAFLAMKRNRKQIS